MVDWVADVRGGFLWRLHRAADHLAQLVADHDRIASSAHAGDPVDVPLAALFDAERRLDFRMGQHGPAGHSNGVGLAEVGTQLDERGELFADQRVLAGIEGSFLRFVHAAQADTDRSGVQAPGVGGIVAVGAVEIGFRVKVAVMHLAGRVDEEMVVLAVSGVRRSCSARPVDDDAFYARFLLRPL